MRDNSILRSIWRWIRGSTIGAGTALAALMLGAGIVMNCLSAHVQAQSTGIREVTASDRSLTPINTKIRFTTLIILPTGEDIMDVLCGDRDFWVIDVVATNIAHVKPAKEGATTNLNLIASSGAIYSFLLTEGKIAPDLKVYVTSDATTARAAKPKYATIAQVEALEGELRQAQAATEAAQRIAEQTVAAAKTTYPVSMRFPYSVPYEKPFLIRSIWHDGRFTYIKTDARELPALYELKDGEPALVTFENPQPNTYVVPKVLESGYFQLGKKRLAFRGDGQ